MALDLQKLFRQTSVAILAKLPTGGFDVFNLDRVLDNTAIPSSNRVRLDVSPRRNVSRPVRVARNPVERAVGTNIILDPVKVTAQGSLSATPHGRLSRIFGGAATYVRRDWLELKKLQKIQAKGEPVVIVFPEAIYPSMAITIEETHTGSGKVDLVITGEEIRVANPLTEVAALDLDAIGGAGSVTDMGAQPTEAIGGSTDMVSIAGGIQ